MGSFINAEKGKKMTNEVTEIDQKIIFAKELRVYFDEGLQRLKTARKSRETALATTKLQEAIMWLGMELKSLGEINPYPNSYKPENTVVDPTAQGLKF